VLVDARSSGDPPHDPGCCAAVHPLTRHREEDRPFEALTDRGASGMVTTLPPMRRTLIVRWPRSRPRLAMSAPRASCSGSDGVADLCVPCSVTWDTGLAGSCGKNGRVSGEPALWWAITIDCHDPRRLAGFWAELLATPVSEPGHDRPGWRRLQPLAPHGPFMNFQPGPERKVGKLRLHIDILVGELEPGVERFVALGGTDTGRREELPRGQIAVMLDPEGNEFCVLAPPPS
jgi:predicted enzyme related to lactoylglutathione lyase